MRVDEGSTRHMQAHGLEQHLVAVGRAVEGAGAGAVIGRALGGEQFLATGQSLCGAFAHARLLRVGQPGRHRPGRHEDARQMSEVQRADQQPRHDLVAHPEQQRRVEDIVRQRHRGAHGDGVAREQAEFHARLALRHAVAHRRHPTRDLGRGAEAPRLVADQRRVALIGLVGRQHVVVGADDGQVGGALRHHAELVRTWQRREGVRHVGAAHAIRATRPAHEAIETLQVGRTGWRTALANACGDRGHGRVEGDIGRHRQDSIWADRVGRMKSKM